MPQRLQLNYFNCSYEEVSIKLHKEILAFLPVKIRTIIANAGTELLNKLEEIRLRVGQPLILQLHDIDVMLTDSGLETNVFEKAYIISPEDLQKTVQLITNSSFYALEEEFKGGYLTLRGGHRVGLVGKVILEGREVKTLKTIGACNLRLARELPGVAEPLMSHLFDAKTAEFYHTMIISPPRCGKTTLLRDVIRQLSDGNIQIGLPGRTVGVVDERGEIAACYQGVPQHYVGCRTDVLDGCPKNSGIMWLLRSMSPTVIATDEIGRSEDVAALEETINAGVKILTTAHGRDLEELYGRPGIKPLLDQGVFERFVILSRHKGVGTIEAILDGKGVAL